MIKRLSIRNYAIIEELEIEFPKGLTIITGETGAGKSILLGALGLIMGERADSKSLFDENKKCIIEANFDIAAYHLAPFFEENDLDYFDDCLIRRELSPSGKSRAFVNDTPVTLDILRRLAAALVDLHQQFDTLDIHQVSFQLRMIDALAGNKDLLATYSQVYSDFVKTRRKLEELQEQNRKSAQESEFLQFQLDEFEKAALVSGEQDQLEAQLRRLSHAEDLKRTFSAAWQLIAEGENPLSGQLREVLRSLSEVKKFSPDATRLYDRLDSAILELDDIAAECEKLAEETEFDPERIVEIQQRLDVIYRLQNKHRVATLEELLQIQQSLQQRFDALGDLSAEIARQEQQLEALSLRLRQLAEKLSQQRKAVIPAFEKKVIELLSQLAMPHTRFEVHFRELPQPGPTGTDEVAFMFAANPGSRLQHIKDVASGGELSRLTLVTKSLVASAIPLPTLIFDEIAAGVGGDVALRMGNILRQLADRHQVLVITHSPQVASKADAHYFVYKTVENNATFTRVKLLNHDERIRSIAVMLSQNPPSESALANARELIGLGAG